MLFTKPRGTRSGNVCAGTVSAGVIPNVVSPKVLSKTSLRLKARDIVVRQFRSDSGEVSWSGISIAGFAIRFTLQLRVRLQ